MEIIDITNGKMGFAQNGKCKLGLLFFYSEEDSTSENNIKEIIKAMENYPEATLLKFSMSHIENVVFAKALRVTKTPILFLMKNNSPKGALFGTLSQSSIENLIKKNTVKKTKKKKGFLNRLKSK